MDNFNRLFQSYQTPSKKSPNLQRSYNQSRTFSSRKKHRNPIFADHGFSLKGKQRSTFNGFHNKQTEPHIQIRRVISDDFCGCENTLTTCKRIQVNYFKGISLSELKNQFQNTLKLDSLSLSKHKKQLLRLLPSGYPQIYFSHLTNLLDRFDQKQMTRESFLCLAGIHFHCKLEYITFFFFNDLKKSLNTRAYFMDSLEIFLLRENISMKQTIQQYERSNLKIKEFIFQFYESAGANLIPLSQYARFLELLKTKGMKVFAQLIVLFIAHKKAQMYEILSSWTLKEYQSLNDYCRQLNWDVFYQQIQIMK